MSLLPAACPSWVPLVQAVLGGQGRPLRRALFQAVSEREPEKPVPGPGSGRAGFSCSSQCEEESPFHLLTFHLTFLLSAGVPLAEGLGSQGARPPKAS